MYPHDPILIIEDDDLIREFMAQALEDEGYNVVSAVHGLEALDIIARSHPSLILLDMCMPVMDGSEFLRAYRQVPGPHAPVIVFTASETAQRAPGIVELLKKPFDLNELLTLVAEHMTTPAAA